MIVGLSGKKQSGKDTVCQIIQYLATYPNSLDKTDGVNRSFNSFVMDMGMGWNPSWQKKMFAEKLKQIVCLLIGCTMEQLEDNEFKEEGLGLDWQIWRGIVSRDRINPIHLWAASKEELFLRKQEGERFDSVYSTILTPRLMLQLMGTECGRDIIHPNIWVNALMSDYKPIPGKFYYRRTKHSDGIIDNMMDLVTGKKNYTPADMQEVANKHLDEVAVYPNWIITDCRFPNEVKAIEDRKGVVIRIDRPKAILKEDLHESETALDNYKFKYRIINDSTIEDLIEVVRSFLQQLNIIK